MVYLEDLGYPFDDSDTNHGWLNIYMKINEVRRVLDRPGYQDVAFEIGYAWAIFTDADIYLEPDMPSTLRSFRLRHLSDFDLLYLKSTLGRLVADAIILLAGLMGETLSGPVQVDLLEVIYVLDTLEEMLGLSSSKFVYARIISPHGPYFFDPDGEIPDRRQSDQEGYAN